MKLNDHGARASNIIMTAIIMIMQQRLVLIHCTSTVGMVTRMFSRAVAKERPYLMYAWVKIGEIACK